MIKLYGETPDEIAIELRERKQDIAIETVKQILIGLETGLSEIELDIESFFEMRLYVPSEKYIEALETNRAALLEAEEYGLLAKLQKWIDIELNK